MSDVTRPVADFAGLNVAVIEVTGDAPAVAADGLLLGLGVA